MNRVRLVNRIAGNTGSLPFSVSGQSGKEYGKAFFQPEFGGPVFEMSLEEYHAARFDLIGQTRYRQQWVPEFIEVKGASNGKANLLAFRELEQRAKAAGVWKKGMNKKQIQEALVSVSN